LCPLRGALVTVGPTIARSACFSAGARMNAGTACDRQSDGRRFAPRSGPPSRRRAGRGSNKAARLMRAVTRGGGREDAKPSGAFHAKPASYDHGSQGAIGFDAADTRCTSHGVPRCDVEAFTATIHVTTIAWRAGVRWTQGSLPTPIQGHPSVWVHGGDGGGWAPSLVHGEGLHRNAAQALLTS
jgi:hypothetical protein